MDGEMHERHVGAASCHFEVARREQWVEACLAAREEILSSLRAALDELNKLPLSEHSRTGDRLCKSSHHLKHDCPPEEFAPSQDLNFPNNTQTQSKDASAESKTSRNHVQTSERTQEVSAPKAKRRNSNKRLTLPARCSNSEQEITLERMWWSQSFQDVVSQRTKETVDRLEPQNYPLHPPEASFPMSKTNDPGNKLNEPVFLPTGLSSRDLRQLVKATKMLGGRIVREWASQVTHVVVACDEAGRTYSRTVKYLMGIAGNRCVVQFTPFLHHAETSGAWPQDVNDYICRGDLRVLGGPSRAFKARKGTIFENLKMYFPQGEFSNDLPPLSSFISIVQLGGGTPLQTISDDTFAFTKGHRIFVICDFSSITDMKSFFSSLLERLHQITAGCIVRVTVAQWIIESVAGFVEWSEEGSTDLVSLPLTGSVNDCISTIEKWFSCQVIGMFPNMKAAT